MKLRDIFNYRYRMGWRIYLKKELNNPILAIVEMLPHCIIEDDDNFLYIRDRKFWE